MGLQEVKDEILNEAEEKAARIRDEGEKKADEIIESAEEEAEKIKDKTDREIKEEKEAMEKKEISRAEMNAKKRIQKARQEVVTETFKDFREKLEDLTDDQMQAFVEEAKQQANFDVNKIEGSEEFKEFVDTEFEEMDQKGLILESGDGKKSLNLTFDRLVDEFKRNYRGNVAQILFDEVKK